jgi:hypothetical protein
MEFGEVVAYIIMLVTFIVVIRFFKNTEETINTPWDRDYA